MQVNWQMLWASKKKRATIRWLGYLVLAFAVLFPVGIFTGKHSEASTLTAGTLRLPRISGITCAAGFTQNTLHWRHHAIMFGHLWRGLLQITECKAASLLEPEAVAS